MTNTNKKTEVAEQSKSQAQLIVNNDFIDALSKQLQEKMQYGLTFPSDYNPTNELMGAYLILKDTIDRDKKPVLQSCSQASIANTLMTMVRAGISMQKGQCYPVSYGGKLSCQKSVYGNVTIARRYGLKDINASVIYKNDTFKFHKENAVTIIDSHEQAFENIGDFNNIIGAYAIAIMTDGSVKAEIMTINQIESAWSQGYGYKKGSGTHEKFKDQMCEKTVKNRLLKHIIRTYGEPTVIEASEVMDEVEDVNITAENAKYDIESNANSEDFIVDEIPEIVTGEVEGAVKSDTPDCFA